ncbi:hypothetical protein BUALT_Bualt01G0126000 [Buddleja alternifolia]|uniref:peptidylprolyl isomerase n=1 Tax=Buddleja alternifolia TaxID=168488 RepID=A0AAV6YEE0_9LAMI|nr:hypothetical protein BUALT_Bualt01G0126000 [Buddleja alternifolia]
MGDSVDLSGDGGVLKTIVRSAKPDAIVPSESLPLVDGMFTHVFYVITFHVTDLTCCLSSICATIACDFVLLIAKKDEFYWIFWTVHYEGILAETGEVFDTTHEDNTIFSFELGQGSVIKAWDVALKTMKVGEVAKITCKPEYAYGSAGSPPDIPPDSTLIFEVELVACRPRKGSSLSSVSDERARLEELKKQREVGAALKEEEKKKREEAKAAAAARIQAKLDAKKGQGKGKGKAK